jgi:hypothetical protein
MLASILLLFLIEVTGATDNPYLGILTYVIFPSILGFGLVVIAAGMLWERRRRRRYAPTEIMPYPVLDLNDPRRRRSFFVFLTLSFLFISISAPRSPPGRMKFSATRSPSAIWPRRSASSATKPRERSDTPSTSATSRSSNAWIVIPANTGRAAATSSGAASRP